MGHPREARSSRIGVALAALACAALACASRPPAPGEAPGPGGGAAGGAPSTQVRPEPSPAPVPPVGAGPARALSPGMDAAATRRAWGEPASVLRLPSPAVAGLVYERWTWSDGREAVLVDGKVIDVLAPDSPAAR